MKDLEQSLQDLPRRHKNIRTLKALEDLLNNLDRIPIEDIEALTQKPVVEPTVFNYEVFFKSEPGDRIQVDGWIAIADDMIPDHSRIEEYIGKGILRKRKMGNPLPKTVIKKD